MRWNIVRAIYLKELRETLRDRRTLVFMLALPLLLYPMMIIGLSRFQRDMEKESSQRTAKLTIWGEAPTGLADLLRSRNFEIAPGPPMPDHLRDQLPTIAPFERIPDPNDPESEKKAEAIRDAAAVHPLVVAARQAVLDRATDLVLVIWPLPEGRQGMQEMAILYDSVRQDSRRARTRLGEALDEFRDRVQVQREQTRQLDSGFTKAIRVQGRDVAPKSRRSGFGAGSLLPFILLAISATAGFYRAVDTTAGEKERNTMQTLLCAPVRAIEIVAGKFAAIASITTLAAAANILSLGMTFRTIGQQGGGMTISLSPSQYLLVFAVLIPVTTLTSALFLAVGVFAKDFRDGQNLLTPVMMLTMMPAAITMLPNIESNPVLVLAPCVNVALLIKSLLVGEAKPEQIFMTLVSSAAYATLALMFAARVFERESILTGGKDTARGIFGIGDGRGRKVVTPSLAFTLFCVVMVFIFYGNSLRNVDVKYLLAIIEWGFILAPTVAAVLLLRLPVKETLALRWPGWLPMVAAVLVGASAWGVATLFLRLLAPPESLSKALQKVMLVDQSDIPLLWIYFIASISPGICEELFFRGLVQGGFRRLGIAASILLSAVLFGVAHGSIYRMMPVTFIGLAIGWLFWHSRSVFPGMLAHAINNGTAISMFAIVPVREWIVKNEIKQIPVSWSLGAAVVLCLGLWLAYLGRRPADRS